ncbi:hypothetical protein LOTGIDRAFT_214936 [Lottia gigantea]|uniref:Actin-modulator n=1 Tax=Lottia gigantea TaxID=225164 RepID=V3ZUV4_LOTGI|nr:hypothetical protein LOTGIDRAFT_214936 [Lottia gigantea]ESO95278.1 hypothetical protein LOTGIDRAFT_214936 [Lottia gigantea]
MSGLIKQKEYDWKDSNLALFGSDVEKNVKKESAETEPAWKNAGQMVGVQVWRIVKFKVTQWPKEEYGKFYNGDSYIILNTYKEADSNELQYDVHFWIGKHSTQDEYGTAAYKTVELDTFLDDAPIQHREVQGHESELFKSYFKSITILEGGAETGFRHVKPEEYKSRLFHFHGDRKGVDVKEISRSKDALDSGDVFIMDAGLNIYQWNGKGSNKDERFKAMQYCRDIASDRSGKCKIETLDEEFIEGDHPMYELLTEENNVSDDSGYEAVDKTKKLFRLSDASGQMTFTEEKSGDISKSDFDSKDVFIFDTKDSVFVWVGKRTSELEKKNAMAYAHKYLQESDHPLQPVSVLLESQRCKQFETALAA